MQRTCTWSQFTESVDVWTDCLRDAVETWWVIVLQNILWWCNLPMEIVKKKFKLFYNIVIFRFWPPSRRENQSWGKRYSSLIIKSILTTLQLDNQYQHSHLNFCDSNINVQIAIWVKWFDHLLRCNINSSLIMNFDIHIVIWIYLTFTVLQIAIGIVIILF